MLKNIKVMTVLTASLLALAVCFFAAMGFSSYSLRASNASLERTKQEIHVILDIADSINHLRTTRVRLATAANLVESGAAKAQVDEALSRAHAAYEQSQAAMQRYQALPKSAEEKPLAEAFEARHKEYLSDGIDTLFQAIERGNLIAYHEFEGSTTPALDRSFEQSLDALIALRNKNSTALEAQSKVQESRTYWVLGLLTLVFAAVGIAIRMMLKRVITLPLKEAVTHLEHIAEGQLDKHVEHHGSNEIGQLFQGLTTMQEGLIRMVTTLRSSSDTVYSRAEEISAGNTDLSVRTEQQAASLEQTAASMEELTATVRQNAQNASQASQLAVTASHTARRGGDEVGEMVTTMHNIDASSRKIADIIAVIDGIAFQTNLLALNASVEAARAGEQGRGFAVVAGEVRNLASRSANAAKEIKQLIEDAGSKVAAGSEVVTRAQATMTDAVGAVQRVNDILKEIALASEEQTSGIEQVNQAVTQMDQVTQNNAALVEESATAAQDLRAQAAVLSETVTMFKLDQRHDTVPSLSHAAASAVHTTPAIRSVAKPAAKNEKKSAAHIKPAAKPAKVVAEPADEWETF